MFYDMKVVFINFKENKMKLGTGRNLILKNDFVKLSF